MVCLMHQITAIYVLGLHVWGQTQANSGASATHAMFPVTRSVTSSQAHVVKASPKRKALESYISDDASCHVSVGMTSGSAAYFTRRIFGRPQSTGFKKVPM